MDALLAPGDLPAYLVRRGMVDDASGLEVVELSGGVSATVCAVRGPGVRLVVKQALPQFRVADEWIVPTERAEYEAQALELMARLLPGSVPRLVDVDAAQHTLVVEEAPPTWRSWKSLLLEGTADAPVAARLGRLLRTLHAGTADVELGSDESFDAQRVDPYLRTVQRRHPELAGTVEGYVDHLLATQVCVVHGDFSPKNVLIGEGGLWVIDWEVVHRGDPAFDVAFLLNHLLLKAIHRPDAAVSYAACAEAFLAAYGGDDVDVGHTLGLVGCLMLARVDGKSPAEYLTEPGRDQARTAGISLLTRPPHSVAAAFTTAVSDPLP